jgi:hydrogenase maturation factor HypF (carbamoyltransferase family)
VVLSGGCFANRRLRERVAELLEGLSVRGRICILQPERFSPGDAALALGQAYVALWRGRLADAPEGETHVSCRAGTGS